MTWFLVATGSALDETDVINDGKENINPNVGAAAPAPFDLDLSAFPPVFRTGEAAQQLLTVRLGIPSFFTSRNVYQWFRFRFCHGFGRG